MYNINTQPADIANGGIYLCANWLASFAFCLGVY